MTSVIPESRSIVLRATHILWIRIEAAQPGVWERAAIGGARRENTLTARLRETLKGKIKEKPDDTAQAKVIQYGTGTTRIAGVQGVWSNHALEPGTEWVVFCQSQKETLAELLLEPACLRVLASEDALTDVRLAMRAETEKMKLEDALTAARPSAASLRFVFAEYLWTRYGAETLAEDADYERMIAFLEDPELSSVTRSSLLGFVDAGVSDGAGVSEKRVNRLALAMFHILGLPKATDIRDQIIETSLPNLLGLEGGGEKRKAVHVFHNRSDERQRAEQQLRNYQGEASTKKLLQWLEH